MHIWPDRIQIEQIPQGRTIEQTVLNVDVDIPQPLQAQTTHLCRPACVIMVSSSESDSDYDLLDMATTSHLSHTASLPPCVDVMPVSFSQAVVPAPTISAVPAEAIVVAPAPTISEALAIGDESATRPPKRHRQSVYINGKRHQTVSGGVPMTRDYVLKVARSSKAKKQDSLPDNSTLAIAPVADSHRPKMKLLALKRRMQNESLVSLVRNFNGNVLVTARNRKCCPKQVHRTVSAYSMSELIMQQAVMYLKMTEWEEHAQHNESTISIIQPYTNEPVSHDKPRYEVLGLCFLQM